VGGVAESTGLVGEFVLTQEYKTNVLQDPKELAQFIEILQRENVCSYLEIGSRFGGSLWRIANALPQQSLVAAVDLPRPDAEQSLRDCVVALQRGGYRAHLNLGDSADPGIVSAVRALGPFDCCFIDGNHSERYVRHDWETYGAMSRMVAFHDIAWLQRSTKKTPLEVAKVWNEIKLGYRHEEISLQPRDCGIGILWRC
jgi:predicted O-methyltransferase YrrM